MPPRRQTTTYGFTRTYGLLESRIRKAGESRGFAVSKLLTHWEEIAGADTAAIARPVEVKYGRNSMGATLVLLTTGAHAPLLEMQKEQLRAKVNGVYGYNAIARVRITQTAPTGFAEGQVAFRGAPKPTAPAPDPKVVERAEAQAEGVQDPGLRAALAALGRNVLGSSSH
ncbi:DUF721 domain-containing protein [Pseudooceanicola sp. CBS1P-1]|uniref:DUF721 domain-containing protein n=1 Tax=Pseudooceanicola albus TaxID=2692189 RepID=A0A6L7G8V9_9RHOB|nr:MULTISPECIES: DciA family protein [Pseudooceanicola]MBT9384064.1 DUF721 domain-containing protein [Pseudooceanicola endophyticus]MXN19836.1 DUF721 domain-containing protein [Pseudooceanicola albus]